MTQDTPKPKSSSSFKFFVVLFILSLALNVFLFLRYARSGIELQDQNEQLISLLDESNLQVDSLKNELDRTIDELKSQLEENLFSQELNESYQAEIEEKIVELESQRGKINQLIAKSQEQQAPAEVYETLAQAKDEINTLKTSNESYISDLEELQEMYNMAQEAADQHSMNAQEYIEATDSLNDLYETLNESLDEAKLIRVNDLNVIAFRTRRGKKQTTSDASKVEELYISFKVIGSALVEKGKKELVFRIIGTSGEVLSDKVDLLSNVDDVFTFSYTTDYDGLDKDISIPYKQKAKFKEGTHRIELYHAGKIVDTREFAFY